jgi:hypothetical protein
MQQKEYTMGYTNYWFQYRDFTDKEWIQIKKEIMYIKNIQYKTLNKITITDEHISFNGIRPFSCETFFLNKTTCKDKLYEDQDLSFHFCKTREYPYDIFVWHILVFCAGMINNKKEFNISRDR